VHDSTDAEGANGQWVIWNGSSQTLIDNVYHLVGQIHNMGYNKGYDDKADAVSSVLKSLIKGERDL
jgi:hypothetical protein